MPSVSRSLDFHDWSPRRAASEEPKLFLASREPQPITNAGLPFSFPKAIPRCFFHDVAEMLTCL
jgi:hypothetical protein